MKKLIILFVISILNTGFSQNITAEVQYEVSHYQCTKCLLTGKIQEPRSIIKISDFRYLHVVYYTILGNGNKAYGCEKQSSCSKGGRHSSVESDPPTFEKEVLKDMHIEIYGSWLADVNLNELIKFSQKIQSDYLKWKKLYDVALVKKEAEIKKQNQELAKKSEQDKKLKEIEFNKAESKLDSLLFLAKYKEAYNYLNEKFKVEPLTIENWNSNTSYQEMNNFFDAIGRGEIKKEGETDVCSFGRCDKFSECGSCRQSNTIYCKGHNEQFSRMSYSNKLYNKWNAELINYVSMLLDKKLLTEAQGVINHYTNKERYINKQEEQNQIIKWNERIAVIEFENSVKPSLPIEFTSDERILIGDWDSKSKNIQNEIGKSYLVDVIRFNADRTFFWLLEVHNSADNSKEGKLEKTGYWKLENQKLTLYVDFESDDKNKLRVNRTEVINLSDLSELELTKKLVLGTLKITMKGTKRK